MTVADQVQRTRVPDRSRTAALVLRALLDGGPAARSTVALRTSLSPATVTSAVRALADRGLVRELLPSRSGAVGRPHVPVDLDIVAAAVGGIHVALEYATVALLDLRGSVLVERRVPHGDAPAAAVLERAAAEVELLARDRGVRLLGVGVATGGWVDEESGVLAEHTLLGWREVPVAQLVGRRLGVPVRIDSHARSLARAEQLFGVAGSRGSVLALFVGNVVEVGFAVGEQVQYGPRSRSGVVAHLPVPGSDVPCECGRTGCLMASVSERRVLALAAERGLATSSIDDLVAAAARGESGALTLLRERAALVGRAAAVLADLLNPEVTVVIEDGVLAVGECLDALREEVARQASADRGRPESVVPSSFGDSCLAIAGGAALLDRIYRDPLAV